MIVSVASGKGGTGKTTVALMLSMGRVRVSLVDCDVEEPNCHLFVNPVVDRIKTVSIFVPVVDIEACTGCGACANVCRFAAFAVAKNKAMIFPELCHSCGGCVLACKVGALRYETHRVGEISFGVGTGRYDHVEMVTGTMDAGVQAVGSVIKCVKENIIADWSVVVDCPPGTSCAMAQAVHGSDVCLLVTEPNAFGFHDLELAIAVLKEIGIGKYGVIVNKSEPGKWLKKIQALCLQSEIPFIAEIPYRRELAAAYAEGILPDASAEIGRGIWEGVGRAWPG